MERLNVTSLEALWDCQETELLQMFRGCQSTLSMLTELALHLRALGAQLSTCSQAATVMMRECPVPVESMIAQEKISHIGWAQQKQKLQIPPMPLHLSKGLSAATVVPKKIVVLWMLVAIHQVLPDVLI
jgi:hypothetical protein